MMYDRHKFGEDDDCCPANANPPLSDAIHAPNRRFPSASSRAKQHETSYSGNATEREGSKKVAENGSIIGSSYA